MTNHIKEALTALSELETLTKNAPNGIKHSYDIADKAQTHALIAIAEQLKVMNLWKICSDEPADPWKQQLEAMVYDGNGFSDDVAEALGIKEEK